MSLRLLCSISVSAALLVASVAANATEAENRQAAQILFDEATTKMEQGAYDAACSEFDEASRLYPEGIGIRESLAECFVKARKYASAEATYDKAISMSAARDPARAERNRALKAEVSPRVSRLTIAIAPELASLPGVSVTRNGLPVSPSLLNRELPVDGGELRIFATANGYVPFEETVHLEYESGQATVVIELSRAKGSSGAAVRKPGRSGLPVAGIITGSVGLVALATGIGVAVSGVDSTNAAVDAYVSAHDEGDAAGMKQSADDHASSRTQALAGWVTTGVGAAALGTGVILIAVGMTAKAPNDAMLVTPWWTPKSAGISALGRF